MTTPRTGLMTSSLAVLFLDDLVPDGSRSDAHTGPPLPPTANDQWTVRVEDSVADVAAARIPVFSSSGIARVGEKLPADVTAAEKKRNKLPVVSDDVSHAVTSVKGGMAADNWTFINLGQ